MSGCAAKTQWDMMGMKSRFLLSLGCHCKQARDERDLPHDVPFFHATCLPFTVMPSIDDQLSLFKSLAQQGSAMSAELAECEQVNERYAHEWLNAMASAGYLQYDPASRRFTLPPEHVPVLAQKGGPVFFGRVQEEMVGLARYRPQLLASPFQTLFLAEALDRRAYFPRRC